MKTSCEDDDGACIEVNASLTDASIFSDAVNLASFFLNEPSEENVNLQEAQKLLNQLGTDGFALVRGTGISFTTCRNALDQSKSFLYDATEAVRRSCLARDRARRGYSPSNTENFASLLGKKGPNDLVRKFRIGSTSPVTHSLILDDSQCQHSYTHKSGSFINSSLSTLHQPNVWPSAELWGIENSYPFQTSLEKYYHEICLVAHKIVDILCHAILLQRPSLRKSLEPLTNISSTESHSSILTVLNYSKGARHQGNSCKPLVAAHTDVGVITVLLFDDGDCAVLQRQVKTNEQKNCWEDIKLPTVLPCDPIFVVNVGDCFSELCEGMLSSTIHRVMPCMNGITPRTTLALFVGLGPDTELTLAGEKLSYAEWRRRRIARAQIFTSQS